VSDRAAFPRPKPRESDDAYRLRLREWFDAEPADPNETPGFVRGEWEYICSIAGISPDPE
jgi:hypothetical protein